MTEMHVLRMDYTTRKRLESRSSENNKKRIKSTSSSLLLVISFRPTDDMMKTETRSPIPFLQMANFSFSSFPFPYSFKEKKGKTTSSPLTPQNTRGRDRQKKGLYITITQDDFSGSRLKLKRAEPLAAFSSASRLRRRLSSIIRNPIFGVRAAKHTQPFSSLSFAIYLMKISSSAGRIRR